MWVGLCKSGRANVRIDGVWQSGSLAVYVEQLLNRLDGVRQRGASRWVAKCPAHADKSPSLSLLELPDGRILVHDFAGCSVESVLDSVGLTLSDLYPQRLGDFPAVKRGPHGHALRDVLALLAREALIVAIAAEDMHNGRPLNDADHVRLWEAAVVIREALVRV